jgi:hypothetical protein
MIETEKVNLAHINELYPGYLKERGRLRKGWKVISSVNCDNGNALILWNAPNGLWVEETRLNPERTGNERRRLFLLASPKDIEQTVKRITSEIHRVEDNKISRALLTSLTS